MIRINYFIFLALLICAPGALAAGSGVSIGNGGQSVACKDVNGNVISWESLDLYEGRVLSKYNYSHSGNIDPLELALSLARKLDISEGGRPTDLDSITGKLIFVAGAMNFLPSGVGLKPTEDSREFIFPKNCDLVQTINFRENRKIYVDSDVWAVLSNVDKAALYLHEAVYWHLRESGTETDSRRTRKIVSYMLSGGELAGRFVLPTRESTQVQFCQSESRGERNNWNTKLFAYRDFTTGNVVIQFLRVGGYEILTKTLLIGPPGEDLPELPIDANAEEQRTISGLVASPMDTDAVLGITWGLGKITVSGFIQEGSAINDKLECFTWSISR